MPTEQTDKKLQDVKHASCVFSKSIDLAWIHKNKDFRFQFIDVESMSSRCIKERRRGEEEKLSPSTLITDDTFNSRDFKMNSDAQENLSLKKRNVWKARRRSAFERENFLSRMRSKMSREKRKASTFPESLFYFTDLQLCVFYVWETTRVTRSTQVIFTPLLTL